MTIYYLLQHFLLAVGLALCALFIPRLYHLPALARVLLGASLTPQVIGLLVMFLTQAGISTKMFYLFAPSMLGALLLIYAVVRLHRHLQRCLNSLRITPLSILLVLMALALAIQLGFILMENAQTLNILPHDFNVYMTSAKVFAANPSTLSMPTFYGQLGEVIIVHPHSFIFEAYLAQALIFSGADLFFPPLEFLPRLAQQLTVVYLLLTVAGITAAMRKNWAIIATIAVALSVPWVDYISASLSRDAFRIVPLFGFVTILSSLGLNFSSSLMKRGLLAGSYLALAVMSHTLSLMFSVLIGISILFCVVIRRRPSISTLMIYLAPLLLVGALSVVRYVDNYFKTGELMGYGLQYSIYKGTWLEPLLGKSWVDSGQDWQTSLMLLLHRYNFYLQLAAAGISIFALMFGRGCGKAIYLILFVGLYAPLLLAISGFLDYAGINLRNALVTNARYPLSFFLLSAPLLVVGIARLGAAFVIHLPLRAAWRQLAIILATGVAVLFAFHSLGMQSWRSIPSKPEDISNLQALHRATECLKVGQNWFIDSDRWNVYFVERPPVFAFTKSARPLLIASDEKAAEAIFKSMNLHFAVFMEGTSNWQESSLYSYLRAHWSLIPMATGGRQIELWVATDISQCIREGFGSGR
jgi:hypothetical protein